MKEATYEDWFADDCTVISLLVNSMGDGIARDVMMLKPAKKVWDALQSTYGNEKNIARMCERSTTRRISAGTSLVDYNGLSMLLQRHCLMISLHRWGPYHRPTMRSSFSCKLFSLLPLHHMLLHQVPVPC